MLNQLDYSGSFRKGENLYGRVLWTPDKNIGDGYELKLEKVYICTGRNGFTPGYDPLGKFGKQMFGCLRPTPQLLHRFLILDRLERDAEDKTFRNVDFQAKFVDDIETPEIEQAFREMVGVDGFIFNTTALYKIEAGHQWFVQVLYSIGPNFRVAQTNKNEYLGFQENPMNQHKVVKRSAIFGIDGDFDSETENAKNGSSLRGITLQNTEFDTNSGELEKRDLIWLAIVGVLLVVIISTGIVRGGKQAYSEDGVASLYQNKIERIQNWLSPVSNQIMESCVESEVRSSLLSTPPAYAIVSSTSRSGSSRASGVFKPSETLSRKSSFAVRSKSKNLKCREDDETDV